MKRHIVEVGSAIVLCLSAFVGYSIASSLPVLSLAHSNADTDATFSDLAPDWRTFPEWRLKWPKLHTFCVGLCTDEELMR